MAIEVDTRETEHVDLYRIFTTTVVPRPISWLSTRSVAGVDNLAPFSLFNIACLDPPLVSISHSRLPDGGRKHTTRNVLDTGEFVHNLVTVDFGERMHQTSANFPEAVSEFDAVGIERAEAVTVDAPRVADALVAFECSLHDSLELGTHTLLLGRVDYVHIDESVTTDGKIDIEKLEIVGRLTAGKYTTTEPKTEYEMVMDIPFVDD
jgi:flavin reductase (DIM6/NTAB) family NADH-FMN oxidoreductase RutF